MLNCLAKVTQIIEEEAGLSFTQQILFMHLACARHSSKHGGYK